MKKYFVSLPLSLLFALTVGILTGQILGKGAMNVIVLRQNIIGQLIMFCILLLIVGFIVPPVTRMRDNISRLLGIFAVGAPVVSKAKVPLRLVTCVSGFDDAETALTLFCADDAESAVLYKDETDL